MRSLAVYLKNYKKESILAPFFKFLEVVFDLIVPIVIAQIIDVGIANHDNGYIVQRFSILILMAALGLASTITAQFFAAKASVGFARHPDHKTYRRYQSGPERTEHGASSSSSKSVYRTWVHGHGIYH